VQDEAERRAEGRIKIEASICRGALNGWFKPGEGEVEWFQDHKDGPEMVVVPAGEFMMGSPESEPERSKDESPLHRVMIERPFAVARHVVTRGQFAAFVSNTSHTTDGGAHVWTGNEWKYDPDGSWRSPGFPQDDNHPVVCVNWNDARAYAAWLSKATGQIYRLPSEAEWEYVARAGTTTPFWWGSSITPACANYDGNFVYKGGGDKGEYRRATVPVGHFEVNPWGLYNVHGNVWEWCEDTWHASYEGAPADGSAWLRGGNASRRVVRGGGWHFNPNNLRSAYRDRSATVDRDGYLGFRVARTLAP
jgi:formylglycine-generating enzyme required for sulfatase activity